MAGRFGDDTRVVGRLAESDIRGAGGCLRDQRSVVYVAI